MKLCFTDFDGVLNNVPYAVKIGHYGGWRSPLSVENAYLDPVNVAALKHIVERTGCRLVISSTWRLTHSTEEFENLFLALGFPAGCVAGRTAQRDISEMEYGLYGHDERGHEISQYLKDYAKGAKYVILDDVAQFLPEQQPFFVNTDDTVGLTMEDAERAISILNN